jgi:hypothetical protein
VTLVRVNANVPWQTKQAKSGNWVAVCEPLKLTVQSETYADLMEDIGLTLDALLRDLVETDELNQFLREHGWQLMGAVPATKLKNARFDVPFHPAMIGNGTARELHQ